jgi:hypothetical protein
MKFKQFLPASVLVVLSPLALTSTSFGQAAQCTGTTTVDEPIFVAEPCSFLYGCDLPGCYTELVGTLVECFGFYEQIVGYKSVSADCSQFATDQSTCTSHSGCTYVAPPPPPVLSSSAGGVQSGSPYTISWTAASGTVNHYTLSKGPPGDPQSTTTFPPSTTSETVTSTAPAGLDRVIEYKVRACTSSDDSACGSWSNAVDVDVTAPCVGRCQ